MRTYVTKSRGPQGRPEPGRRTGRPTRAPGHRQEHQDTPRAPRPTRARQADQTTNQSTRTATGAPGHRQENQEDQQEHRNTGTQEHLSNNKLLKNLNSSKNHLSRIILFSSQKAEKRCPKSRPSAIFIRERRASATRCCFSLAACLPAVVQRPPPPPTRTIRPARQSGTRWMMTREQAKRTRRAHAREASRHGQRTRSGHLSDLVSPHRLRVRVERVRRDAALSPSLAGSARGHASPC